MRLRRDGEKSRAVVVVARLIAKSASLRVRKTATSEYRVSSLVWAETSRCVATNETKSKSFNRASSLISKAFICSSKTELTSHTQEGDENWSETLTDRYLAIPLEWPKRFGVGEHVATNPRGPPIVVRTGVGFALQPKCQVRTPCAKVALWDRWARDSADVGAGTQWPRERATWWWEVANLMTQNLQTTQLPTKERAASAASKDTANPPVAYFLQQHK